MGVAGGQAAPPEIPCSSSSSRLLLNERLRDLTLKHLILARRTIVNYEWRIRVATKQGWELLQVTKDDMIVKVMGIMNDVNSQCFSM